jgi:hypothetical protein
MDAVAAATYKAEDVQTVDFTQLTEYVSSIRVGKNQWGLLVTPVNDGIAMCTGQNGNDTSQNWRRLTEEKKQELQEDLKDEHGIY